MRQLLVFSAALLLVGACMGQVTVLSGYAGNQAWAGYYPVPFVPLITTPSISLGTLSFSPMGASNGTGGNVAGATNSTLSLPATPSASLYTVPVWYGPNPAVNFVWSESTASMSERVPEVREGTGRYGFARPFNFGIGSSAEPGVAEEARLAKANRTPAVRMYTNSDIERVKQQSRSVR